MSCGGSVPRRQPPYLCECPACVAEWALLYCHYWEADGAGMIKCKRCALTTEPRSDIGERMHAVFTEPDWRADPTIPHEAKLLGFHTPADALKSHKPLSAAVLAWCAPEAWQAKEIRERCSELVAAAASAIKQRKLTRRLFAACRSVLQLERFAI